MPLAALLIVPTASMAEHLLHQRARAGEVVSPASIQPVDRFVERFTPECKQLSLAAETLLLARALENVDASEFAAVAGFPGFQTRLLDTIKEFWSAGAEARQLEPGAFARVMAEFEKLLRQAGAVHREQRIRLAAGRVAHQELGTVAFDGFFSFTAAELALVKAVGASPELCVSESPPRVMPHVVRAPSPEREIEDVAGRILRDHEATRRPFREYGLILRTPDLYAPIIQVVFERFGIPFRMRHPRPLDSHSAIQYLLGRPKLEAGGFNAAQALEVMKHAGSGLGGDPQMDRYEFALREQAPGDGLEFLRRAAGRFPRVKEWLERLPGRFHLPVIQDGISHAAALDWRTLAQALRGWENALVETASAPGGLETTLRLTSLRTPDRRREVVQVLTVYEARQWELPVVFVCGLVEKQFPRHHAQNLFFPDGQRRGLALKGINLRTSEDLDREERVLFDVALSRATEQLYLTYPSYDEDGTATLRSFFLEGLSEIAAERFLLREEPPHWIPAPAFLQDQSLLPSLAEKHARFSPSALEKYIQCPFLFFADRTLRLKGPPPSPEERIDELLKGIIIHRAIARWTTRGGDIVPVFEEVFEESCADEGIRLNFRAEALKMELRADLERFAAYESGRPRPAGFTPGPPETEIQYIVEDGPFRIAGRIDRHEISGTGAVIVVDYKYSRGDRIKRLIDEHEDGIRLQGPLYLIGLEKERGLTPAGMLLYGLRKEPSRRGWLVAGLAPLDPDLVAMNPEDFRAMLDRAAARTVEIAREIRQGRVEVRPLDRQVCREYCLYREVCRVKPWG